MLKINSSSAPLVIPLKFLIPLFPSLHNFCVFQAPYWMKCFPYPLTTYFSTFLAHSGHSGQETCWLGTLPCHQTASRKPWEPQKPGQRCVHALLWLPTSPFIYEWRRACGSDSAASSQPGGRGALYMCRGEIREWGTSSAWDLSYQRRAGWRDPSAAAQKYP